MFNEVFITDAHVGTDAIIGGRNNGWAVANTTLSNERAGLGAGGGGGGGFGAMPGTVANQLGRKVGEFVSRDGAPRRSGRRGGGSGGGGGDARSSSAAALLIGLAEGNGKIKDPTIRQDLVRLHTLGELGRLNNERVKAARTQGQDIPGMANVSKLSMSHMVRLQRDLGLRIVGAQGMLHAYKDEDQKAINDATGNPFLGAVTNSALYAQAPPIYGGTDQIQRNIIGERVLGLPKEPSNDRVVPFSELPRNG
jgi:alkylation response protein AidB-like acyl-CoA dehydrogenase